MKFSFILFVLVLFIFSIGHSFPVTLIKHDNTEIKGNLLKSDDVNIIKLDSGKFKKNDIKRIRFEKKSVKPEKKNTDVVSSISKKDIIARAQKMKKMFPDAGYITLVDHAVNEYIDEKNSISTYHGAYIIMKDDFKQLARLGAWIDESKMSYRIIYGRIIYPDGTEFYMNPKDLVKSVPKDKGAAFFSSRGAVLYYNFPKASAGCIVEYKHEYKKFLPTINNLFESRFTFNGEQPVESSVLEVIMPQDKKLYWAERNMTDKEKTPKIATNKGKTTYLWDFGIQKALIKEPSMPDLGDVCKVMYYSNQESMEFIFKWHRGVLAKNMVVTPLITKTVNEILEGVKDDPVEIVRHLYHYMQREIRYVSIKSGSMSGLAGHFAEETLQNKFGDCVDKGVLFSTMLKVKNIESYPIIINTNPKEEMESRVATINGNHCISQVVLNGKKMLLDTTSTNHSFPYFRFDDHGVPVYNSIKGEVFRSEVPPPEDNLSKYTRNITIDPNGKFTVDFKGEYNGNRASGLRGYYKTVPDKDLKKVFEGMVKRTAPDAKLLDYAVNNKADLFKDISIEYSYTSKEFLKKAGNLLIMKNLCPLPFRFNELSLKKRKYDIEYYTTLRRTHINTFKFASNYSFTYVPEPIEIKNKYVYYKAEYDVKGKTLAFKETYDLKKRIVKKEDYDLYKSDILKILDYQKKNVILSRGKPKNYADLLILKKGDELDGEILGISNNIIKFEKKTGEVLELKYSDILSIELAKTGGKAINLSLDEIMDEDLEKALLAKSSLKEFPGSLKVILLDKHYYKDNRDGTFTYTSRIITRILSEKGKNAGFDNWNIDPVNEKFNIDHAYTINGNEVTSLSSRTIKTALAFSAFPEYQRMKNTKFAMPKIKVGSVLDYQVSRIIKMDPLQHPFSVGISRGSAGDTASLDAGHNSSWNSPPCGFYSVVGIVRKELVFEVPKKFKYSKLILNNEKNVIIEKKTVRKDSIVYRFVNSVPMAAKVKEYKQTAISDFWPIVLFSKKYTEKKLYKKLKKTFVLKSKDKSAALKQLKELEKKIGVPDIADIYEFVAKNIYHVPVGIKDYKFKPKPIAEILKNKKASILDTAWLLYALLKAGGFKAELCLVPTSWFSKKVFPKYNTMNYFSNLLVRVKHKKEIFYISALDSLLGMKESVIPFEGLEVIRIAAHKFIKVNIPKSNLNDFHQNIAGKIDEKGSMKVSNMNLIPKGLQAKSFRNLRKINSKKWPIIAANVVNSYHSNAVLKNFMFKDINDLKKTPSVEFSFDIPNYCTSAGDLFFMKLIDINHVMPPEVAPMKRKESDIDLGLSIVSVKDYKIEIPENFSVFYLPEDIKIEDDNLKYSCTTKHKGNLIVFKEEFKIKETVIPIEKYRAYQKFRKKMADFSEEYIIFKKK